MPRQIDGPFGLQLSIESNRLSVAMERSMPRAPVPPGGATGSGADVTVEFDVDDTLGDAQVVERGIDFIAAAANRVLWSVGFLAGNQKRIERLVDDNFENLTVEVNEAQAWRILTLPAREAPGTLRLKTETNWAAAQIHLDAWRDEFVDCGTLWGDSVVSFYEGREAEGVQLTC